MMKQMALSAIRAVSKPLQNGVCDTFLRQTRFSNPYTMNAVTIRFYRGESGEMEEKLSEQEQKLVKIAQPKYDSIYEKHIQMPKVDNISNDSLGTTKEGTTMTTEEIELDIRKKRLIYRAKQRGWLEVDLLLGTYASKCVPSMTKGEMDEFERFVNLETIDIYNFLTFRADIPDKFLDEECGVVKNIQEWAKKSPLGKASPSDYAAAKKDNNLI
mmetsp:Transcript_57059/g.66672  ORF Transcript_57059/g.66672 Transcript_57059/m.66672 type:complete len:214 (-) Transcript_57059:145-786(-)|eukprot:CAMPEP_0194358430 /NCGR_PEP_ID=MMETSP0174-20130528/5635_1 /TAXON_ID=216777 /ORGANISM="Proboscia alata, Strain PI-D3" /LENGTH=213 /DNA_ID=CAMNT_0039128735 /DNA_START=187 /DNA_END=828 /DNA_ORIENTATION=+